MIVTCPSCSSKYRLSDDKIQGRGARITCPSCSHRFVVYRNEEQSPTAPVMSVSAGRGVPVKIARQGQVVRPQPVHDPDEEAPTTLMAHGSGMLAGRTSSQNLPTMGMAEEEDPEPHSISPAQHAPPPPSGQAVPSRFATYLLVTVIGVALLVFLISNGMLG